MKSTGLGDTVERITRFTGIKKLVDFVNKEILGKDDCGCNKRKTWLNRLFPYKNK